MNRLFVIAVLLLGSWLCRADSRVLEAGTPLFTGHPSQTPPETIITGPVTCRTGASRFWWQRNGFAMYRFTCIDVTLPDGSQRIAVPQIAIQPDGSLTLRPETAIGIRIMQWLFPAAAAMAVFLLRRRRNTPAAAVAERALPVLVRGGLLIFLLAGTGAIYLFSSDEPDFFVTCASLMQGDLTSFQPRSLGTGLWYLPFALWRGAADITGILAEFSWFSAFIAAPAAILCWQCAAERLSDRKTALAAALLFAVLPLFWFHYEPGGTAAHGLFQWPADRLSYELYQTMIAGGFCAMSDTPAMLMLFAALLTALLPTRPLTAILCGLCAGMAILLRINAVLYLPALLLAPVCRDAAIGRRDWLRFALWMLPAALLIMIPQLISNAVQLGSPLTFPYVRYENTADGFALANMAANWPLLMCGNRVFFFAGFTGMLLMHNRRSAGLLAAWCLPTWLFFLGYYHTRDDLVRFILPLYAPLLLAAWMGWRDWAAALPPRYRRIMLTALAVVFITGTPVTAVEYTCWQMPPFLLAIPGAAALTLLTTAILCRRRGMAVWLAPLTAILYLAGLPC